MDWDKHLWESYGNPMYVRPHPPGETWAQSIYDPEHVEIHRWPSHKFDMKEWEAVEGLWHKYNTITVPLLDYNAFMLDLREISAKTNTREELEAQLQERREQRADELKRCFKNMRAYVGIILEDYEEALNSGLGPGSLDHNCDWWVSMRSILREGSMASIAKFLGDIYRSAKRTRDYKDTKRKEESKKKFQQQRDVQRQKDAQRQAQEAQQSMALIRIHPPSQPTIAADTTPTMPSTSSSTTTPALSVSSPPSPLTPTATGCDSVVFDESSSHKRRRSDYEEDEESTIEPYTLPPPKKQCVQAKDTTAAEDMETGGEAHASDRL